MGEGRNSEVDMGRKAVAKPDTFSRVEGPVATEVPEDQENKLPKWRRLLGGLWRGRGDDLQDQKPVLDSGGMSRREFFNILRPKGENDTDYRSRHANGPIVDKLQYSPTPIREDPLSSPEMTRKSFLKLMGIMGAGVLINELFNNWPLDMLNMLMTDEGFRKKLLEEIRTGEVFESVQQAIESQGLTDREFEIIPVEINHEPWMSAFTKIDAYSLRSEESKPYRDDPMVAFMQTGTVSVIESVIGEDGLPNFTRSIEGRGVLATLPSNQLKSFGDELVVLERDPALYCAYQKESGEVVEFPDSVGKYKGGRSPDRGAVIVDMEGKCKVCLPEEARGYRIGENCRAIESAIFIIDSEVMTDDLEALRAMGSLSGARLDTVRRFNSCVVTFIDHENNPITKVLSRFQSVDSNLGKLRGASGDETLLTVGEMAKLCNQYMTEQGYTKFLMQIPDPGNESSIKTSEHYPRDYFEKFGEGSRHLVNDNGPDNGRVGVQNTSIQFHRVLGDAKPFEQPLPKKIFLATTS